MADKGYLRKIQAMTDIELDRELDKVMDMQSQGYDRMNGKGSFNLLAEASVNLCNDAICAIKEEQNKRKGRI